MDIREKYFLAQILLIFLTIVLLGVTVVAITSSLDANSYMRKVKEQQVEIEVLKIEKNVLTEVCK